MNKFLYDVCSAKKNLTLKINFKMKQQDFIFFNVITKKNFFLKLKKRENEEQKQNK